MALFLLLFLSIVIVGMVGGAILVILDGIFRLSKSTVNKATKQISGKKDIEKLYGKSLDYIKKHPDEDYGLML